MKKILIGNWKMNPATRAAVDEYVRDFVEAHRMLQESGDVEFWLAPPSLYIPLLVEMLAPEVSIGAQDVSEEERGSRTGEISAVMARNAGAGFAIVGHSERRAYHGEDNEVIAKKVVRMLESKMKAVVCVGESREERDAGQAKDVVSRQVRECLDTAFLRETANPCHCEDAEVCHCEECYSDSTTKQSPDHARDSSTRGLGARNDSACARDSSTRGLARNDESNILIAYEPVWAIGSGSIPSSAEIREMRDVIRDELKKLFGNMAKDIPILYGGSVTSKNAWETIVAPAMDGALIGGASLDPSELVAIAQKCLEK